MLDLVAQQISCPYCGRSVGLLIDPSVLEQEYVEDCSVCCQPILVTVWTEGSEGGLQVLVRRENE